MRHRGSTGLARIVALATICMAGPVQGRSWGTPGRDYGRYGILTMVCDERRHAAPCLGLACFDRTLALVSAAGGGGPMEGATRVSNGRTAFTLRFEFDPAAIDRTRGCGGDHLGQALVEKLDIGRDPRQAALGETPEDCIFEARRIPGRDVLVAELPPRGDDLRDPRGCGVTLSAACGHGGDEQRDQPRIEPSFLASTPRALANWRSLNGLICRTEMPSASKARMTPRS